MTPKRFFSVGLLAAVIGGCTPDPKITYEYAPYAGTAYPNRAKPIPWPAGGAALVSNSYSDTVSVVDVLTGKPIYTRPVGRNPIDLDGPHHIVADPSRRVAFIALAYPRVSVSGPHASHGSSLIPGYVQKLSLDDLSILGSVRVENNPGDIVISEDKSRIVVSHFDLERATKNPTNIDAARADLAVIDPSAILESGSPRPTFIPTCVAPHAVVLEKPDAKRAWVACYGEDSIAVVDLVDTTAPIKRIPVGPNVSGFGNPSYGPYSAAMSPDQSTIAFCDKDSRDVRFFDVATESFDASKTVTTLGSPLFPKFSDDGKTLWIPTQQPDAIVAVDLTGAKMPVTKSFVSTDCVSPHVVERAGGKLFVVCEGDLKSPGSVVALDDALNVVSTAQLGVYPDAFYPMPPGFQ